MGVTQYITVTAREYALWNRLEGAVAGMLKTTYGNDAAARTALFEALRELRASRNGAKRA